MQEPQAPPRARVFIQRSDFDLAHEVAQLRAGDARVGAVCAFVGTVRDRHAGAAVDRVSAIELEHYPGMTEKAIEAMIDAAHQRFDIVGARVVHRIGLRLKNQAFGRFRPQRASAASSLSRASTQRAPPGVVSFFQNGAWVLR